MKDIVVIKLLPLYLFHLDKCFLRIIINEIIIIHLTNYLDGFYYCLYKMMLFYERCNLSESAQEKQRWKK